MRPIDYFDAAVIGRDTVPAVKDTSAVLSYGELKRRSTHIASTLLALCRAPKRPRPIAIVASNSCDYISCMLGAMRAGIPLVPLHSGTSPEDCVALLKQAAPACVVYDATTEHAVALARTQLSGMFWMTLESLGSEPSSDHLRSRSSVHVQDWGGVTCDPRRTVYLRFTSGTSGKPKLVVDDIATFNATYRVLRWVLMSQVP